MSLTDDLSGAFFDELIDLCGRLSIDPMDLLGVMMAESNVRASAKNPISNASGLIQFLPATLENLGWAGTPEEFRKLDADKQLPYVEAYFQPYVHFGLNSAARVYQVVFLPSSLPLGSDFNTVIAAKGGINSAVYDRNRGLDVNFDGKITVGELQQAIERRYTAPRWQEIMDRLGAASGGQDTADDAGADPIDLRTQPGIANALEALGFDREHYTFNAAVRAFQLRSGLVADGIVGPKTRGSLRSALDENEIRYIS
jgi:hypothetical protein